MGFVKSHACDQEKYQKLFDLPAPQLAELADEGDPYALTILAQGYRDKEEGHPHEPARAVTMLQRAAAQDFAPAQIMLAECYRDGVGVPKNRALAIKWLQKATERKAITAFLLLGLLYLEEGKTEAAAVELIRHAAENDDPSAMYVLGDLYRIGRIVEQDQFEAFNWMQLAASKNHESAQIEMGIMLMLGEGCGVDHVTAVDILSRWAEAGDPDALFIMSEAYRHGWGVAENHEKRFELLQHAAELGHPRARVMLAELAGDE